MIKTEKLVYGSANSSVQFEGSISYEDSFDTPDQEFSYVMLMEAILILILRNQNNLLSLGTLHLLWIYMDREEEVQTHKSQWS